MRIEIASYDHPEATALIDALQRVYAARYGEGDATPTDPAEFRPPRGLFLLGYLDGRAVASGGWRAFSSAEPGYRDGDAERM
ncbi:hypothetical protein [Saccharopolyspora erythraea]|uniref:Acetyltransferase n=2 Tax=Saccharopolyspora erythraea TaxID=1836 RepID=A4FN20_SACEN|nr:hypothetical protein [Saccharopolyspora erythraea]CAM05445.1 acetyltransferase [Saccharopolyspora erythraea NRRL 2338]